MYVCAGPAIFFGEKHLVKSMRISTFNRVINFKESPILALITQNVHFSQKCAIFQMKTDAVSKFMPQLL
jgi:hypothetical protein